MLASIPVNDTPLVQVGESGEQLSYEHSRGILVESLILVGSDVVEQIPPCDVLGDKAVQGGCLFAMST